jgi:hypothetical protein
MGDELYCKVYVKGVAGAAALKAVVAELANGAVERRHVSAPPLTIDVFDQSRHVPADVGNEFVRWPAYLEVGASGGGVDFVGWLAALAALMHGLRARGLSVAASCDFEDALAVAMQAQAP